MILVQDISDYYGGIRYKRLVVMAGLIFLLFLVSVVSVGVGPVSISPTRILDIIVAHIPYVGDDVVQVWPDTYNSIVMDVRLPRVILGVIVGMGLAISGAAMQGMFRNPMASPYVCGISSGGAFGAALAVKDRKSVV